MHSPCRHSRYHKSLFGSLVSFKSPKSHFGQWALCTARNRNFNFPRESQVSVTKNFNALLKASFSSVDPLGKHRSSLSTITNNVLSGYFATHAVKSSLTGL